MASPPRSRAKRERDPAQKRQRILGAAHEIIRERGGTGATCSAIARRAGVSEAIIFHHFGSKQGLMAAAAGEYGHGIARAIFAHAVPGVRPELRPMVAGVFDYVRENGHMHDFVGACHDGRAPNSAFLASREVVVGALAQAFTMYRGAGWIRTDDPHAAAVLTFGMVQSALLECFSREPAGEPEVYIDACVAFIERALYMQGDGA